MNANNLLSLTPVVNERPAPWLPRRTHRSLVAFTAVSLMAHASLYAAFSRQPDPLASIGEVLIEVDLVLGHDKPAGISSTQEQAESKQEEAKTNVSDAREIQPTEDMTIANSEALDRTLDRHAALEVPDEPHTAPRVTLEPAQSIAKATEDLRRPVERGPEVEPTQRPQAKPAPVRSPREKRAEPKEAARIKNTQTPARVASLSPASGAGLGRSDDEINYRGIVAAHLARHKQFPADAQSRGETGSATVAFALDGGGRVASVRLVRPSGSSSLNGEAQTMVRRASPFPPPPGGRTMSFTVPLSFHLR